MYLSLNKGSVRFKTVSSFSFCHHQSVLTSTTTSYTYARFQASAAVQLWSLFFRDMALHQWVIADHVFKPHSCLKMSCTLSQWHNAIPREESRPPRETTKFHRKDVL